MISYPGGRFFTITSLNADKGKAIERVKELYIRKFGEIESIGIGDSYNDIPLFKEVDRGYLVQNYEGKWAEIELENLRKVAGAGPKGWVEIVESIFH